MYIEYICVIVTAKKAKRLLQKKCFEWIKLRGRETTISSTEEGEQLSAPQRKGDNCQLHHAMAPFREHLAALLNSLARPKSRAVQRDGTCRHQLGCLIITSSETWTISMSGLAPFCWRWRKLHDSIAGYEKLVIRV